MHCSFDVPGETAVETAGETGVETAVETAGETDVETEAETAGETDVETGVETVAETAEETCVETVPKIVCIVHLMFLLKPPPHQGGGVCGQSARRWRSVDDKSRG